ncbi:redoxin domain-containing protein [Piscinibacter sp.]|uniref:redoxin domain-containing protein n=1 Tax=Piscinibacter sp. TaxID=1903157 RepID=UPI002C53A3F2|nr:redoxin domain-containing protein [Albitalea sp.]HUG21690.1 redoxin domain-containing protein [Albitalea sp.]
MKLTPGDAAPAFSARTIRGKPVRLPNAQARFVHLQFRRFAGCPVCNFHLLTMGRRHAEIEAAGIHQVVFFHSSQEEMLKYQAQLPFDCIADLEKKHFRAFGVEASGRALLSLRILWKGFRGVLASRRLYDKAENGILGLPADFLVDAQGRVVACKYGAHADDQWDADDVLRHAGHVPLHRD